MNLGIPVIGMKCRTTSSTAAMIIRVIIFFCFLFISCLSFLKIALPHPQQSNQIHSYK